MCERAYPTHLNTKIIIHNQSRKPLAVKYFKIDNLELLEGSYLPINIHKEFYTAASA